MKSIWTIIAVMALANILAIGGLLGWLHVSGRLNRERVDSVKGIFTTTVADEQSAKANAETAAKQAEKDKAAADKAALPPKTAAEMIAEEQFRHEQRDQVVLRQQQELESLRSALMVQLGRLEDREKKLAADRTAFAAERKKIAETEGQKQFKDAIATLEGQKPRDAKLVLQALLDAQQVDQVVAYLARMEEGKRSKVIAEFVKDSPAVAADLLERLRTRGGAAPVAQSALPTPTQAPAHDLAANQSARAPE